MRLDVFAGETRPDSTSIPGARDRDQLATQVGSLARLQLEPNGAAAQTNHKFAVESAVGDCLGQDVASR
jgi:hypothetical protein